MNRKLAKTSSTTTLLLSGLSARTAVTDCPLGAFKVVVVTCSGQGECPEACLANVFATDEEGKCTVVNDALCFGCMACVAQCREHGIVIIPNEATEHPSVNDLIK